MCWTGADGICGVAARDRHSGERGGRRGRERVDIGAVESRKRPGKLRVFGLAPRGYALCSPTARPEARV